MPTVAFSAAEHRRSLASTKLYCWATEARACAARKRGWRDCNLGPVDRKSRGAQNLTRSLNIIEYFVVTVWDQT